MKTHPDCDILFRCALGELEGGEEEAVRRHLALCPGCREEVESVTALSRELGSLPAVNPGENVWSSIETALGEKDTGIDVIFSRSFSFARRPLVYATLALLIAGFFVYRIASARRRPAGPEVGIAEMGSRIAHRKIAEGDLRGALEDYFAEAGSIVDEALRCADSRDEKGFAALKEKISTDDMLYRASSLRGRLAGRIPGAEAGDVTPGPETASSIELIDDSALLMRVLSSRTAMVLAERGEEVRNEIARMNLRDRLEKGGLP